MVLPLGDTVPRGTRGSSVSALAPQFHHSEHTDFLNLTVGLSMVILHACLLGGTGMFVPVTLMLTSLWVQPQVSDRLQEAMVNFGFFFFPFGFCLQIKKSFCKTAECQYEFYGFNLL